MKKIILRVILIILICLWMWLVFGLSSDNAEKSSSLSFKIAKFIFREDDLAHSYEGIIRKIAHLSEYTVRTDFYFMVYF